MQSVLPNFFFYLLASVILFSGILTITRRNAVHSAIWLVVTLLGVAGLYLHQDAEFLAAVQVLVYIGGITVLFLFVIMLVNVEGLEQGRIATRHWWWGVPLFAFTFGALGFLASRGAGAGPAPGAPELGLLRSNTEAVATRLFTGYLLPFEIVSVLLLVAMIGAIVLAKREL